MGFITQAGARLRKAVGRFTKSIMGGASTVFFQGPSHIWDMFKGAKARYEAGYWLKKFNECSILQRPIRRLMEDFAAVPFKLKRKRTGKNGRTILEDVFEHPAMELLDKPNPFMTGNQFKELWEQSMTVTGQFLIYVEFDEAGYPEALWPIGSDKIKLYPDPSKRRYYWEFYGPRGETITAGPESIMYQKLLDGANIYGAGVGLCTGISRQIDMYEAATDWSLNFFKKGSHVGAIVHIPDLAEGEGAKLQAHWNKEHTGIENAHKTLFVTTTGGEGNAKVTVNKMGAAHKEIDFSQGIRDLKDQVRENFNLPAELVGDSKSTNRAASQASENFHQKNNIRPRAIRAASFLNCFYVPLWNEPDLVITFEDPVKEDLLIASKTMLDGVKNGCATRDEWRELRGMEPMETAFSSGLSFPLNMTILNGDGEELFTPQKPGREDAKPPEPDGDQAEQVEKQISDVLGKVAASMELLKFSSQEWPAKEKFSPQENPEL